VAAVQGLTHDRHAAPHHVLAHPATKTMRISRVKPALQIGLVEDL
jgi:hypothetical protein